MYCLLSANNTQTEIELTLYTGKNKALLAMETSFLKALPVSVDRNSFPDNLAWWHTTEGWAALLANGIEATITETGASVFNSGSLVYWQVKELPSQDEARMFALFSTRTYENGEHYEGVDGIYPTFDLAQAAMEDDYADQCEEDRAEKFTEDYCEEGEAKLAYDNHEFTWKISEHIVSLKR